MSNLPTINNNPGDLKNPTTGQFDQFSSPQEGWLALTNNISQKIAGTNGTPLNGNSSLTDFADVWAPSSDSNDPTQYADNLAVSTGTNPSTPISQIAPSKLAAAVAKNEGYQGPAFQTQTEQQFGQTIQQKYPAYASLDPTTVAQKVLAKYPQYNGLIDNSQSTSSSTTQTPKDFGFSGWINSLNPWEKAGLIGLGTAGIVGGSIALGGADLPFLGALGLGAGAADVAGAGAAGAAADVAGAGAADVAGSGVAGTAAAGAAGAGAAETPSILSKIIKGGELIGTGAGIADTASQVLNGGNNGNINANSGGGGGQSNQTPPISEPANSSNHSSFTPAPEVPFTPESYQQSSQASQALLQAQQSAHGATPTGRVYIQSPNTQNGMNYNATYGLMPTDDGNGNFTTEEADAKTEDLIDGLNGGVGDVLRAEGNSGDNVDAWANARSDAHAHNNPLEYDEIDKELESLAGQHTRFANDRGDIPLDVMNELRKGHGRASRFDIKNPITPAKRAAHKAMYFALRQEIEKKTENKELYNRAMREEKGLIDGKKANRRLNGKKIPIPNGLGKRVAEAIAQYASTAIGARLGGPWGAVVGAIVGHGLDKIIEKKFGKNIIENKGVKVAMESLAKQRPEVEKLLRETIQKYINRQNAEKEYQVIKKDIPKDTQTAEEKEMGTYKLSKNPVTGRVDLNGQYREPGISFYKNRIKNSNNQDKKGKQRVGNQKG